MSSLPASFPTMVNPPVVIEAKQSTVVPIISGQVLSNPRSSTPPTEIPHEPTEKEEEEFQACVLCAGCLGTILTVWAILSIYFTVTGDTKKSFLWNPGMGGFVGIFALVSCYFTYQAATYKPNSIEQTGPSSEPVMDGQRCQENATPLTRFMQSQDNVAPCSRPATHEPGNEESTAPLVVGYVAPYSGPATFEHGNQEPAVPFSRPFIDEQRSQGYVPPYSGTATHEQAPNAPLSSTVYVPGHSYIPTPPQNPYYGSGITYPSTTQSTIYGPQNNNWEPPPLPGTESFTATNAPSSSTLYVPGHSDIPPSSQNPYYGSGITYPSTTQSKIYGPQNNNWQSPILPGTESFTGASPNIEPPPYELPPYGVTPYEPPK